MDFTIILENGKELTALVLRGGIFTNKENDHLFNFLKLFSVKLVFTASNTQ